MMIMLVRQSVIPFFEAVNVKCPTRTLITLLIPIISKMHLLLKTKQILTNFARGEGGFLLILDTNLNENGTFVLSSFEPFWVVSDVSNLMLWPIRGNGKVPVVGDGSACHHFKKVKKKKIFVYIKSLDSAFKCSSVVLQICTSASILQIQWNENHESVTPTVSFWTHYR